MIFLDTNILLYSISTDAAEVQKCQTACLLLDRMDIAISVQVLGEFFVQATRVSRSNPLDDEQASALISTWLRFPVQSLGVGEFKKALALKQRYQLSYWDSAIIAAALAQQCDTLMTEDMQHGMIIESLRIENPFL